jgi:hypothetical protein
MDVFMIGGLCAFCAQLGNDKLIECPTLMQWTMHAYEVRPRKDKRGIDLISDALPFGRLWYGEPNAATNAVWWAIAREASGLDRIIPLLKPEKIRHNSR